VLTLVGIGVGGARGMGAGAREAISSAKAVYMETFTSPVPREDVEEVRRAAEAGGAAFRLVPRWAVEDGGEILRAAAAGDAALVCYGDPYVATTHIELRTRAAAAGTPTRTVHGASALTGVVGECGLHQYKVGRTATVTRAEASTPYDVLRENIDRGCHTVLLLEYDEEGGAFMAPREPLYRGRRAARAGPLRGRAAGQLGGVPQGGPPHAGKVRPHGQGGHGRGARARGRRARARLRVRLCRRRRGVSQAGARGPGDTVHRVRRRPGRRAAHRGGAGARRRAGPAAGLGAGTPCPQLACMVRLAPGRGEAPVSRRARA